MRTCFEVTSHHQDSGGGGPHDLVPVRLHRLSTCTSELESGLVSLNKGTRYFPARFLALTPLAFTVAASLRTPPVIPMPASSAAPAVEIKIQTCPNSFEICCAILLSGMILLFWLTTSNPTNNVRTDRLPNSKPIA